MDEEVLRMQTDEIISRARLLDNEIKVIFLMFSVIDLTRNSWPSHFVSYIYCWKLQLNTVSCLSKLYGSVQFIMTKARLY